MPAIIFRSPKCHLLGILILILILTSAGCSSPDGKPAAPATPAATVATAQPEQLSRQAQELLAAAARARAAGDYTRALQLYRQIDPDVLPADARPVYFLDHADAALQDGEVLLARELLTAPAPTALSQQFDPAQRQRWLRLRGELFGLVGETEHSLAAYTELADSLTDAGERGNVEQAIWGVLRQTPTEILSELARDARDPRLHGWYQLALAGRARTGAQPVAPAVPAGQMAMTTPAAVAALDRVALLLPESGAYATAADVLRDGFLAAAFAARSAGAKAPDVRLYDTAAEDVAALYQRAAAEGAQLVIGPLEPESLRRLSALTELPVPVLSLNYLDSGPPPAARNFHQFGLSVAQEAEAAAHSAWRAGHRAALALAPNTSWGDRALSAFRDAFQGLGGSVRSAVRYDMALKDFTPVLRPALAPTTGPGEPKAADEAESDADVIRRRTDVDLIFLVAYPTQGRQIKPTLDFLYAGDLPIYATSSIYSGTPDPARDADLDGIRFLASPWTLADPATLTPSADQRLPTAQRQLFALGVDSYLLHAQLAGALPDNAQAVRGQTGELLFDGGSWVQRRQPWARFVAGRVEPLPGEPDR